MVFLRSPNQKGVKYISFDEHFISFDSLTNKISTILGFYDFLMYCNDQQLEEGHTVSQDAVVQVTFSLPGGKGGFGSMLRAIGAQIEKTTNREACRDLSGRRLRDINEEQRLKKWISKESEREREKAERRKARIERLKSKPKHNFVDFDFEKERSELPERIDDALTAGLQKASKRSNSDDKACASTSTSSKKKRLWMNDDLSDSSESDLDESSTSSKNSAGRVPESDSQDSSCSSSAKIVCEADSMEASTSSFSKDEVQCEADSQEPSMSSFAKSEAQCEADLMEASTSSCSKDEDADMTNQMLIDSTVPESSTDVNISNECKSGSFSNEESSENTQKVNEATKQVSPPLDLSSFDSASELEGVGLDRLKSALQDRGLKCGGSVTERAQRLWKVRDLEPHQYPANLLAKKK